MTRTLTALLLLTSVSVSAAQVDPQWLRVMNLRAGTPVKVLVTGMTPIEGYVVRADEQVLLVSRHMHDPQPTVSTFARDDIDSVSTMQVSKCRSHRGTWILVGALIGLYAGFAIGAARVGTETGVGIGGDIGAVAGGVATARLTRCRSVDIPVYRRPLR